MISLPIRRDRLEPSSASFLLQRVVHLKIKTLRGIERTTAIRLRSELLDQPA
jgi:hypothetical protein